MSALIRVRVAGILSENGKVLLVLHEKEGKQYWLLPGGGVEFGETLAAALVREFKEEVDLTILVEKLLFVNETIDPKGGRHGLHFAFLVKRISGELKVAPDFRLKDAAYIDWEDLNHLDFRPQFGKTLLKAYQKKFNLPVEFLGNLWVE